MGWVGYLQRATEIDNTSAMKWMDGWMDGWDYEFLALFFTPACRIQIDAYDFAVAVIHAVVVWFW